MPWIAFGEPDAEAELAAAVHARLERRVADGMLAPAEIAEVTEARVRLFDPGGSASEAFRRLCVVARVDAPVTLKSHRPIIGGLLVGMKRVVARLLRFHVEVPLARQAEFNRNVLVVLQELYERLPPRADDERS